MTAMPDLTTDDVNRFDLLEMDNPTAHRTTAQEPEESPIMLDLVDDVRNPTCIACSRKRPVDERALCQECAATDLRAAAELDNEFGAAPEEIAGEATAPTVALAAVVEAPAPETQETVVPEFAAIAAESTSNAATAGIGSMRGGQLRGGGFSNREGYITAIRNGVRGPTHASYLTTLRTQYGMTTADLAALNLPGPMVESTLPVGPGIVHTPTGPGIFDRPRSERAFVVGPKEAPIERLDVAMTSKDLVAGAVAEGHHAIVAWEGSSGMTRGDLVGALAKIGREAWSPKAPNARAQAGSAIATLSRQGLAIKPLHKGTEGSDLAAGEHAWTVGRVAHASAIGDELGKVVCRFKLSGSTLSYTGDAKLGDPVIAAFGARMASEIFKSGDVTSWLSRTIRWNLDGVRFGALGWLVPARNVEAAKQLCEAVRGAGFGSGWVTGLPVATSDQLRDGIVRGLIDEVAELHGRIAEEQANAKAERERQIAECIASGKVAEALEVKHTGKISSTRAESLLKELRAIGGRVVAYGQVLGEGRVESAQSAIKAAIVELEGIAGDDYQGIRARFSAVWDEIEFDRKRTGGVL